MSNPAHTAAWLLVRRATTLTDAEIISITGVHPEAVAHMRRRLAEMLSANIERTGSWWRDGAFMPNVTEGDPETPE